jgi:hypothetical protein
MTMEAPDGWVRAKVRYHHRYGAKSHGRHLYIPKNQNDGDGLTAKKSPLPTNVLPSIVY